MMGSVHCLLVEADVPLNLVAVVEYRCFSAAHPVGQHIARWQRHIVRAGDGLCDVPDVPFPQASDNHAAFESFHPGMCPAPEPFHSCTSSTARSNTRS